jgi:dTDP-4-amino-4,6-dideoxygalactose transaminase
MPVPLLDLRAQHATIRDEVVRDLMRVVDDQLFILGEPVERLEKSVAELSKTKYAIGCANGTDAILLSLRALDIGRGDEVVTTPFTFFATAGTVHNVGATPVFVDIEPDTFNISADAVRAAIGPKTKAVIPVDLFGQMAAIERVEAAAPAFPSSRMPRSPSARSAGLGTTGSWPESARPLALSASSPRRTWAPTAMPG